MSRAALLRSCSLALALSSATACKNASFHFKNTPAAPAPTPGAPPSRTPEEAAFLEKCAALGASGGSLAGLDGWFFSTTELQRLALLQDPAAPSIKAASAAIADYHAQLKAKGIDLVFVPVPPKAILFPDKLAKDLKIKRRHKLPARLDSTLQATYAQLRSQGIRVIDLTDPLLAAREDPKLGPIFPKTAAVWAPRGAQTAAAAIAAQLRDTSWPQAKTDPNPLIAESSTLSYVGPLPPSPAPPESLALRNIGRTADGKMRSVTFSQGGHPLALLGDSSLLAWREANNPVGSTNTFASLADQLAFELQTTPDLFPGNADGRNAARLAILREGTNGRNPLGSAKVVLWVVQATDLALSDWKRVPLRLQFNLTQPPLLLTTPSQAPPLPNASPSPAAPTPDPKAPEAPAPEAPTPDSPPALPPLPR